MTINRFSLGLRAADMENILAGYEKAFAALKDDLSRPDTTYTDPSGSTSIPAYLTAGLSYQLSPKFILDAAWQQRLQNGYFSGPALQYSVGLEYLPVPFLPLYAGIGMGRQSGFKWGLGFALYLRRAQWSFGFGQSNGIFNSAKGASVATELRLVL